jgi:hypothetical protein
MNPVAHLLFGAVFATCLITFGIEMPRRRQGLGRSELGIWRMVLVILLLAGVAAAPQATRYFGDRKLDSGPVFNLFLFHDVLELASQRFRLGDGFLDSPVILSALGLGVSLLLLVYLRSENQSGWDTLWRDAAYFSLIIVSLVAIRVAVSSNSHIFLPQTLVYINRQPYIVVENSVFYNQVPIVGVNRDRALAIRDAFLAVNRTGWKAQEIPDEVNVFMEGSSISGTYIPPLSYNSLVSMMSWLRQHPDKLGVGDLERIIRAGTLPQTDMPLTVTVGFPLAIFAVCSGLIYPGLEPDGE